MKVNSLDISSFAETAVQSYLGKMKTQGRLWSSGKSIGKVYVAGRLQNLSDLSENTLQFILEKTNAQEMGHIKKALRIKSADQKFYSEDYTRMKKRLCHIVRCENGDIRKIMFFVVNTQTEKVYAYAYKIEVHEDSFICDTLPRHIIRVIETEVPEVIPVDKILDKVFLLHIDNDSFITFMPNKIGHSVFK